MSLSSLPTALLIPPVNLVPWAVAGALLAGFAGSAAWRRRGRVLVLLSVGGLFVLSLPLVGTALLVSLECGLPQEGVGAAQAIVILSGDAGHGVPSSDAGEAIGGLTLERMRTGAAMHRRTGLPVLVSGGVLEPGAAPIAAVMAESLRQDFAVPVRWVEDRSDDTWQNAQYSAAMLRRDDIVAVVLVTHGWHMRRSRMAFARAGIATSAAPVRIDAPPRLGLDSFVPSIGALHNSYYAIHEWIGCLYYLLPG